MFWPGVTEVPDLRYRRLFHYAAISTMDGAQHHIASICATAPKQGAGKRRIEFRMDCRASGSWGRCPSSSKHLLRDPTREIRFARWCVRLPPPVLPPRVRERCGQNQHPARDRACRGTLALHQPHPHRVQRGFQEQDGGGLEGRHMTDGARHEQVSQSDLKYAEIEEHSEIEQARVRWRQSLR